MKTDIKIYALSYASFSGEDSELYTCTIGAYGTYEEAEEAMKQNVKEDIEGGDDEDNWDVNGNQATYSDDFSNEYKAYSITAV